MEPTDADDVEEQEGVTHTQQHIIKTHTTREHHRHTHTVTNCDVMRSCLLNNQCSMR